MDRAARPALHPLLSFLIHLRLRFVAILAPIFLWGAFVAGGRLDARFWLGFAVFHLCLYGGVNALNTFYDRDEGPIGGLKSPPPVHPSQLWLAWGIQLVGFGVTLVLPPEFRAIYLAAMLLSVAYSHPALRLKGHPLASVLIVGLGQGWLTYWAGWLAAGGAAAAVFSPRGLLGGAAVSAITAGFYPLTQVYQMEVDRARGDHTLAVWLGARNTFRFALAGITVAAACMISLIWSYVHRLEAVLLAGYFTALWIAVYRWSHNRLADPMEEYDRVIKLNLVNSACLTIYMALHFARAL